MVETELDKDPQLEKFILAETQKQRFQVNITLFIVMLPVRAVKC